MCFSFVGVAAATTVHQETDSLKLTEDEEAALNSVISGDDRESENLCYFLAGIILNNKGGWTVWLNDKKYSHNVSIPGITIMRVESNRIQIKPKDRKNKDAKWIYFKQTYCVDTDDITPSSTDE
jgi:hypothetical protein